MDQANYAEKAIEILDAAEIRMRQGGFNAVSYRDLATDVGIKGSSVHYHFPKKSDLGRAVVDRYTDRILEALGAPDDPQEDVKSRIHRLCTAYEDSLLKDGAPCLGCVLGSEALHLPSPVADAVSQFFVRMSRWTTLALEQEAQASGSSTMARHIIGTLQGTMILVLAMQQPDLFMETEASLLQFIELET